MNKLSKYILKHILLFCGIEERISCSYMNKIMNQEYKSIVPNVNDAKSLLGDLVRSIENNRGANKMSRNNMFGQKFSYDFAIMAKSYLSHSIVLRPTRDGIMTDISLVCSNDELFITCSCIIENWSSTYNLDWYGNELKLKNNQYDDESYQVTVKTFNCPNVISMLNNLVILIKKGSPKIYGNPVDWSKSYANGLEWST
jgi:hypothetical protein